MLHFKFQLLVMVKLHCWKQDWLILWWLNCEQWKASSKLLSRSLCSPYDTAATNFAFYIYIGNDGLLHKRHHSLSPFYGTIRFCIFYPNKYGIYYFVQNNINNENLFVNFIKYNLISNYNSLVPLGDYGKSWCFRRVTNFHWVVHVVTQEDKCSRTSWLRNVQQTGYMLKHNLLLQITICKWPK